MTPRLAGVYEINDCAAVYRQSRESTPHRRGHEPDAGPSALPRVPCHTAAPAAPSSRDTMLIFVFSDWIYNMNVQAGKNSETVRSESGLHHMCK